MSVAPRSAEQREGDEQVGSQVPRVLLADHDPSIIELMAACVARSGWALETVPSGASLLEALSAHPFDVVVVDLLMPGIDGLSLLRQIRSQRPAQPIILVSSGGSLGEFVSFLKEGVSDVLQKPVDSDALSRAVQRVVLSARDRERSESVYRYVRAERTEFSFASKDLAESRLSLGILERLRAAQLIDVSLMLRLELAFQEMLANALEHGNLELDSKWKEDFDESGVDRFSLLKRERLADKIFSERLVEVVIDFKGDLLSVSVKDSGKGFVPKIPEEWKAGAAIPHGRGLAMIYAAADDVTYSENGRKVTIRKRVGGDCG